MKKLFALLLFLAYSASAQIPLMSSSGAIPLKSSSGNIPIMNSANNALPSLPLASGALIGRVGHSFIGFEDSTDTIPVGADNYDYGAGNNFAWALWPDFNIDAWYDTSTHNNYQSINGSNYGYPSDHLEAAGAVPGCMSRWPFMVLTNAKIIVDDCAVNTINSGDTGGPLYTNVAANTAYIESEIQNHINLAAQYGKWIIIPEITPIGLWPDGDSRYTVLANVNTWIDAQTSQANVKVLPRYSAMLNADLTQNVNLFTCDGSTTLSSAITTTGQTAITVASGTAASIPQSGAFTILVGQGSGTVEQMHVTAGAGTNNWTVTRGAESTTPATFASGSSVCAGFIHPNNIGANIIGAAEVTLLQTMISAGSVFNQDGTQAANLNSNGGMTGTTGTCNGTGMSGTLATNYTATFSTNRGSSTAVCSQTTIDGTHTKNTITVTPGNTSALYDVTYVQMADKTTALPLAGQCVEGFVHVTTGSIAPSRMRLQLILTQVGTTPVENSYGMSDLSTTFTYPGLASWSGWFRTDPIKVPLGALNRFRMFMYAYGSNTGSAYAYSVDNWIGLVVPCPWLAWGLNPATP